MWIPIDDGWINEGDVFRVRFEAPTGTASLYVLPDMHLVTVHADAEYLLVGEMVQRDPWVNIDRKIEFLNLGVVSEVRVTQTRDGEQVTLVRQMIELHQLNDRAAINSLRTFLRGEAPPQG
jgi:hypothetical protein